jgi:hypothetical protein
LVMWVQGRRYFSDLFPKVDDGGPSFSYSHESCASATTGIRTGPNNTPEQKNQCMFLRGFKIALREDPMSRVFGPVALTSIIGSRRSQIIPRWNGGSIPYIDNRRWPSSSGSSSNGSNSGNSSRTSSPLPPDFSDSSEDESDDISTDNSSVDVLPSS